jgi:hypothetical protein
MKTKWTKIIVVGVILLASAIAAGYIMNKKWRLFSPEAQASIKKPQVATLAAASIQDRDNVLQVCYESYLGRGQDGGVGGYVRDDGQVLFHMMINKSGEVKSLELVKSDFSDDEFHQCLAEKIRSHRVPASADRVGVMIAHKFKFRRKEVSQLKFVE